jgi:hypothetical protein
MHTENMMIETTKGANKEDAMDRVTASWEMVDSAMVLTFSFRDQTASLTMAMQENTQTEFNQLVSEVDRVTNALNTEVTV